MSRLNTLRAGTAHTKMLAAAIRAAADGPSIVLVRLRLRYARHDRPYRDVEGFDAKFRKVPIGQDAVDAIDLLIRGGRPDIDWRYDHDWHLDTGMLRRSPGINELGYVPDDDQTFGGGPSAFLVNTRKDPSGDRRPAA